MEKEIKITENTKKEIVEVADELKAAGFADAAQAYFADDDYPRPYFKVAKPFEKESESDPDAELLFLDVGSEYDLHTRFGHEHFDSAKKAVETLKGLYDGKIVGVALCLPDITARFLVENTGDIAKNVAAIDECFDTIVSTIERTSRMVIGGNGHVHVAFGRAYGNVLQILGEKNEPLEGCEAYYLEIETGKPTEYFLTSFGKK